MSKLNFELGLLPGGFEPDGVTPRKLPCLHCQPDKGFFLPQQRATVQRILDDNKIPWMFQDNRFTMHPKVLYEVLRICEEQGFGRGHIPPYFAWQKIVDAEELPELDEKAVEIKVGSELWAQLHPYQKTGIKKMIQLRRSFNSDEQGTGKTIQSLVCMKYFDNYWPCLILCPSSLRYTWKSEIQQWLGSERTLVIRNSKDTKKIDPKKFDFVVISYNLIIRKPVLDCLKQWRFPSIILDESHYIKSLTSKRSSAAIALTHIAEIRILLSGTPCSYAADLFTQIKALDPTIYPRFFHYREVAVHEPGVHYFAERYCNPSKTYFRSFEQWVFHGYERSEELAAIMNSFMIRRKKSEVLSQLPAKNRICITLPRLSKAEQGEIDALLKGAPRKKKAKRSDTAPETKSTEDFMKAFRLTSKFKGEACMEFVEDRILGDLMTNEPGMKVIIFFHHKAMKTQISQVLQKAGMSFFLIDGSTNPMQRDEYKNAFQNTDQYRVALLSITACSTGLTLTAANTVVFTEILFSPSDHLQAEDRVHRISQKSSVNIFYLIQPGTSDDINFGLIKKKERESSTILDGAAGNNMPSERFHLNENSHLSDMLAEQKKRKNL